MAKRRISTEVLIRQTLVSQLLSTAAQYGRQTRNGLVEDATAALDRLETVTPEQVTQSIALIDNAMETTRRFAQICKNEREVVAETSDQYIESDEVEAFHARPFTGSHEQGELVKARVYLQAVYTLLTSKSEPSILSDMIPVPTDGSGGGRQNQQDGGPRQAR
jgi:regulator of extracellular matrix RemA (YlzA/DUF370 family)